MTINPLENTLSLVQHHWTSLAYGWSVYWGLHGAYFFTQRGHLNPHPELFREFEDRVCFRRTRFFFWGIHMFVFNFVGSLAAWACLYILIARIESVGGAYNALAFGWSDLGLFVFAVIGITGHLPQALYGIVTAFGKLAESIANRISS